MYLSTECIIFCSEDTELSIKMSENGKRFLTMQLDQNSNAYALVSVDALDILHLLNQEILIDELVSKTEEKMVAINTGGEYHVLKECSSFEELPYVDTNSWLDDQYIDDYKELLERELQDYRGKTE